MSVPNQMIVSDTTSAQERPQVGLVFALGIEAGSLVDRMSGVKTTRGNALTYHHGLLGGVSCVLVESGIGRTSAEKATEAMMSVFRPKYVISAGFAGALDPALRQNTIHRPTRICCDKEFLDIVQKKNADLTLLTVDKLVDTIVEKRRLWETCGAHLVDMESFAVAEVCRKYQVDFQSVRIVFDAAEEELPQEIRGISDPEKKIARKLGVFVGAFFKRPSCVVDLYQFRERALVSADRLALELEKIVRK